MLRSRKRRLGSKRIRLGNGVESLEQRNLFASLAGGDFNGDGFQDSAFGVIYEKLTPTVQSGAVNVIYGSATGLVSTGNQFWHQDSPGINGVATDLEEFGYAIATGDFNNDGRDDIAIGIPNDRIGTIARAGSVQILYGSPSGLTSVGNQLWNQASLGVPGTPEVDERFGADLTTGDFDGDGFADLAIGAPQDRIGSISGAGSVTVLRGSANGLTATRAQFWNQDSPGIPGVADVSDFFGVSLAAGDFNKDGKDDLAIGVPRDSVGPVQAGTVFVMFGSSSGLTHLGIQIWSQNSPGIADNAESLDEFGTELAVGDFDGDLFDDLAIGVPFEGFGRFETTGAVHIIRGSASGLTATQSRYLTQETPGIPDSNEGGELFGIYLSTGDFNADGRDDLAIGTPLESLGAISTAGAVTVVYGSANGATGENSQQWTQDSPGILDVAEASDFFASVNTGDFNGDGKSDLLVFAPNESVGPVQGAGSMHVIYGSTSGLRSTNNQVWNQNSPGILDTAETGDSYPAFLALISTANYQEWLLKRSKT